MKIISNTHSTFHYFSTTHSPKHHCYKTCSFKKMGFKHTMRSVSHFQKNRNLLTWFQHKSWGIFRWLKQRSILSRIFQKHNHAHFIDTKMDQGTAKTGTMRKSSFKLDRIRGLGKKQIFRAGWLMQANFLIFLSLSV